MIDVQLHNTKTNEVIWLELPYDDFENYGEDWEILDAESSDCSVDFELDENWDLLDLQTMAEDWAMLSDWENETLTALVNSQISDLETALGQVGSWSFYPKMSLAEVAEELTTDCYNIPQELYRYFDFEAMGRDLANDGYIETEYGVLYR